MDPKFDHLFGFMNAFVLPFPLKNFEYQSKIKMTSIQNHNQNKKMERNWKIALSVSSIISDLFTKLFDVLIICSLSKR